MAAEIKIPIGADTRELNAEVRKSALKGAQLFNKSISKGATQGLGSIRARNYTEPLGRIKGSADEFTKSLEASNARVVAFGFSAGIIYGVEKAFRSMLEAVIDVEKSLTDINVILGLSTPNLKRFGDELFNVAKNTGQTFRVVAEAATELARQGLGVEETLRRTRDAMILTRLSGLAVEESVQAITAAINSFNETALDSTQIINKLANVDAAFAVSSADLAEAIRRVGSTAQDAGVTFDRLIALVTTAQQITARGGAKIGNSFKTIFTRIQRPQVLDQLQALGIAVRDLEGFVLPADQVLKNLADSFDRLSEAERSQVSELVGSVFQINVLKAILSDLNREVSTYDNALRISSSSVNEAILRNKQLNETLSTLVNKTFQELIRSGQQIGELSLRPAVENILNIVNTISDRIAPEGEGIGADLAKGIFAGLGKFLGGPGLLFGVNILFNLLKNFGGFIKDITRQFIGTEKRLGAERAIATLLKEERGTLAGIIRDESKLLDFQTKVVQRLQQQRDLMFMIQKYARASAPIIMKQAPARPAKGGGLEGYYPKFASGYVPQQVKIAETLGALKGGYIPGEVQSLNMPNKGTVYYNTAEKVKDFGFDQPAIMPPKESPAGKKYKVNFQKAHGFDPFAAEGEIPNFVRLTGIGLTDRTISNRLKDKYKRGVHFSQFYDKYETRLKSLTNLSPKEKELFSRIYASLSYQTTDQIALDTVYKIFSKARKDKHPRARNYIEMLRPLGFLGNRIKSLDKAFSGQPLGGEEFAKTREYLRALSGNQSILPMDRNFIGAVLGRKVQQGESLTVGFRERLLNISDSLINELGGKLTRRQFHAAIFAGERSTLPGKRGITSFEPFERTFQKLGRLTYEGFIPNYAKYYHGSPYPLSAKIIKGKAIKSRPYSGADSSAGEFPKIGGGTLDEFGLVYFSQDPRIARHFASAPEMPPDYAKKLGLNINKGAIFESNFANLRIIDRFAKLTKEQVNKLNKFLPEYKHLKEGNTISTASSRLFETSSERDKRGLKFALDVLGYDAISEGKFLGVAKNNLPFQSYQEFGAKGFIPNYKFSPLGMSQSQVRKLQSFVIGSKNTKFLIDPYVYNTGLKNFMQKMQDSQSYFSTDIQSAHYRELFNQEYLKKASSSSPLFLTHGFSTTNDFGKTGYLTLTGLRSIRKFLNSRIDEFTKIYSGAKYFPPGKRVEQFKEYKEGLANKEIENLKGYLKGVNNVFYQIQSKRTIREGTPVVTLKDYSGENIKNALGIKGATVGIAKSLQRLKKGNFGELGLTRDISQTLLKEELLNPNFLKVKSILQLLKKTKDPKEKEFLRLILYPDLIKTGSLTNPEAAGLFTPSSNLIELSIAKKGEQIYPTAISDIFAHEAMHQASVGKGTQLYKQTGIPRAKLIDAAVADRKKFGAFPIRILSGSHHSRTKLSSGVTHKDLIEESIAETGRVLLQGYTRNPAAEKFMRKSELAKVLGQMFDKLDIYHRYYEGLIPNYRRPMFGGASIHPNILGLKDIRRDPKRVLRDLPLRLALGLGSGAAGLGLRATGEKLKAESFLNISKFFFGTGGVRKLKLKEKDFLKAISVGGEWQSEGKKKYNIVSEPDAPTPALIEDLSELYKYIKQKPLLTSGEIFESLIGSFWLAKNKRGFRVQDFFDWQQGESFNVSQRNVLPETVINFLGKTVNLFNKLSKKGLFESPKILKDFVDYGYIKKNIRGVDIAFNVGNNEFSVWGHDSDINKLGSPFLTRIDIKNKGLIPNFAALDEAISREIGAGIPISKVRLGKDSRLRSLGNPLGLGIFNTRDEPGGLHQGIKRAKSEGLDPKKYGIPGFADGGFTFAETVGPQMKSLNLLSDELVMREEHLRKTRELHVSNLIKHANSIERLTTLFRDHASVFKQSSIATDDLNKKIKELGYTGKTIAPVLGQVLPKTKQEIALPRASEIIQDIQRRIGLERQDISKVFADAQKKLETPQRRKIGDLDKKIAEFQGQASNILSGGKAIRELQDMAPVLKGADRQKVEAAIEFVKRERTQAITNRGFQAAFVLPFISGLADQFAGEKISAGIEGIANILSQTATGAVIGGPYGAVAGAGLGIITSLPKVLEAWFGPLKELQENFQRAQKQLADLNDGFQKYANTFTKIQTLLDKGVGENIREQLPQLQQQLTKDLLAIPKKYRAELLNAGTNLEDLSKKFAEITRRMQEDLKTAALPANLAALIKEERNILRFVGGGGRAFEQTDEGAENLRNITDQIFNVISDTFIKSGDRGKQIVQELTQRGLELRDVGAESPKIEETVKFLQKTFKQLDEASIEGIKKIGDIPPDLRALVLALADAGNRFIIVTEDTERMIKASQEASKIEKERTRVIREQTEALRKSINQMGIDIQNVQAILAGRAQEIAAQREARAGIGLTRLEKEAEFLTPMISPLDKINLENQIKIQEIVAKGESDRTKILLKFQNDFLTVGANRLKEFSERSLKQQERREKEGTSENIKEKRTQERERKASLEFFDKLEKSIIQLDADPINSKIGELINEFRENIRATEIGNQDIIRVFSELNSIAINSQNELKAINLNQQKDLIIQQITLDYQKRALELEKTRKFAGGIEDFLGGSNLFNEIREIGRQRIIGRRVGGPQGQRIIGRQAIELSRLIREFAIPTEEQFAIPDEIAIEGITGLASDIARKMEAVIDQISLRAGGEEIANALREKIDPLDIAIKQFIQETQGIDLTDEVIELKKITATGSGAVVEGLKDLEQVFEGQIRTNVSTYLNDIRDILRASAIDTQTTHEDLKQIDDKLRDSNAAIQKNVTAGKEIENIIKIAETARKEGTEVKFPELLESAKRYLSLSEEIRTDALKKIEEAPVGQPDLYIAIIRKQQKELEKANSYFSMYARNVSQFVRQNPFVPGKTTTGGLYGEERYATSSTGVFSSDQIKQVTDQAEIINANAKAEAKAQAERIGLEKERVELRNKFEKDTKEQNALLKIVDEKTKEQNRVAGKHVEIERNITLGKQRQSKILAETLVAENQRTDLMEEEAKRLKKRLEDEKRFQLREKVKEGVATRKEEERYFKSYRQEEKEKFELNLAEAELRLKEMTNAGMSFSEELIEARDQIREYQIRLGDFTFKDFIGDFRAEWVYTTNDFMRDISDSAKDLALTTREEFKGAMKDLITGAATAREAFHSMFAALADKTMDRILDMAVNSLFSTLSPKGLGGIGGFFGKGGLVGYSRGGLVTGGTGVKDDVPGLLDRGEYVVNKNAVQKYGKEFFENLNNPSSEGVRFVMRNRFAFNDPYRPTGGAYEVDPRLSAFALTDEANPQNALKFERANRLYSYLDYIISEMERRRQVLDDFKKQQTAKLRSAWILAGTMAVLGGVQQYSLNKRLGTNLTGTTTVQDVLLARHHGLSETEISQSTGLKQYQLNQIGKSGMAEGGRVRGKEVFGIPGKDKIPVLLQGGEYVIQKKSVDAVGQRFLEELNKGTYPKFAQGGLVGQAGAIQPAGASNTQNVNNVNITINIDQNNQPTVNATTETVPSRPEERRVTEDRLNQFAGNMKMMVLETIQKELKPNGLLWGK